MSVITQGIIHLTGDVSSADFPVWIQRHARKLGLGGVTVRAHATGVDISAQGSAEMVHALALGASLGPQGVLVETVSITTNGYTAQL